MGTVLGKIWLETPNYKVLLKTSDYEIRKYSPSVIAEITYNPYFFNNDKDAGFRVLEEYTGAYGTPQNLAPVEPEIKRVTVSDLFAPKKIAMTSPLLMSSHQGKVTMGLILPGKYKNLNDAPMPMDERVNLRKVEWVRKYGVVRIWGAVNDKAVKSKAEELRQALEGDNFYMVATFLLAKYYLSWTLSLFGTNEIMMPIEERALSFI